MFSRKVRSLSRYQSIKYFSSTSHHTHEHTKKDAHIIDGDLIARGIKKKLKHFIDLHANPLKERPGIAFLLLNDRVESRVYVKQKVEVWNQLGLNFFKYEYPTDIDEHTVLKKIEQLNERDDVHGIMVQLPMPENLAPSMMDIINRIDPDKDVEGISDHNMSKVFFGDHGKEDISLPCTSAACLHILKEYNISLSGKYCVIPNKSRIVGLPLSKLLLQHNATVTVCNPHTTNIQPMVSKADILFSAVGKFNSIKPEWIKEGSIVIDIATNFIHDHHGHTKMVGDIDFNQVKNKVQLISPVPGGVGPVTVMMLTKNIVATWAKRHRIPFNLEQL